MLQVVSRSLDPKLVINLTSKGHLVLKVVPRPLRSTCSCLARDVLQDILVGHQIPCLGFSRRQESTASPGSPRIFACMTRAWTHFKFLFFGMCSGYTINSPHDTGLVFVALNPKPHTLDPKPWKCRKEGQKSQGTWTTRSSTRWPASWRWSALRPSKVGFYRSTQLSLSVHLSA